MDQLEGPYEIFELSDGESFSTRVEGWKQGEVKIHPAKKPDGKMIKALRIDVPKSSKQYFPWYWDITSQTLIAQLIPFLESPGYAQKIYTITKHGVAPRARFTLAVN